MEDAQVEHITEITSRATVISQPKPIRLWPGAIAAVLVVLVRLVVPLVTPEAAIFAGDRTSGYLHAKEQLFRTLDDVDPNPRLAELEASIMAKVNDLEIGPMGFSGRVTLIGCKVGALNQLPASFFISVAYDCWAFRRLGVLLDATTGAITRWLYRDSSHPIIPMLDQAGLMRTGREVPPPARRRAFAKSRLRARS